MKPGIINLNKIDDEQGRRVWEWLVANGCRHYVGRYESLIYTGNRLIVPTYNIERLGQKNIKWAQKKRNGKAYLPIKIRTYRVRVPFAAIREGELDA